ncbi:hypothetical protein Ate01nite_13930 [Actinoplanes teichomyceticus]|nr:hypothetical protein [Actinoplanes teichomyceticus]GIF11361.1 hypothetical protein Ate01nite_13930 [Actinoplanes teichomyceticus]
MVSQGQFALVPGQQSGFPLLGQRLAPAVAERPGKPGERGGATPQTERGPEPCGVRAVVAGAAGGGEIGELQGVDGRPRDVQRVAAAGADDQPGVQTLAQPQDVVGDHRHRAGRRPFPEQPVDQLIRADRGAGAQRERRQHRRLLGRHPRHPGRRGALAQDRRGTEKYEPEH